MSDQPTTPAAPPAAPAKPKKPPSRSQRWTDAVGAALDIINEMSGHLDALDTAIEELRGVQEEYEEWQGNLPENLASSALGEKLDAVCGLEIEAVANAVRDALDEAQGTLEDADQAELPQGFGRD